MKNVLVFILLLALITSKETYHISSLSNINCAPNSGKGTFDVKFQESDIDTGDDKEFHIILKSKSGESSIDAYCKFKEEIQNPTDEEGYADETTTETILEDETIETDTIFKEGEIDVESDELTTYETISDESMEENEIVSDIENSKDENLDEAHELGEGSSELFVDVIETEKTSYESSTEIIESENDLEKITTEASEASEEQNDLEESDSLEKITSEASEEQNDLEESDSLEKITSEASEEQNDLEESDSLEKITSEATEEQNDLEESDSKLEEKDKEELDEEEITKETSSKENTGLRRLNQINKKKKNKNVKKRRRLESEVHNNIVTPEIYDAEESADDIDDYDYDYDNDNSSDEYVASCSFDSPKYSGSYTLDSVTRNDENVVIELKEGETITVDLIHCADENEAQNTMNLHLSFRQANSFEMDGEGNGKFYIYGLTTEELDKISLYIEIYLITTSSKSSDVIIATCSSNEIITIPESGIAPVAFECTFNSTEPAVASVEIAGSDSMAGFPSDESLLNPFITDDMIKAGQLPNMTDPEVANNVPPSIEIKDFNFDNAQTDGTFEIIANCESDNLKVGQRFEFPLTFPSGIDIIMTISKISSSQVTFKCQIDQEVQSQSLYFEQKTIIYEGKELFTLPGFKTDSVSIVKRGSSISVDDTDDETDETSLKESTDISDDETKDNSVEESSEILIDETTEAFNDESAETSDDDKAETTSDESSEKADDESAETTTDESVETITDESAETITDEIRETTTDESVETITDESAETIIDEIRETIMDESAETIKDEAAETIIDETGETIMDESAETIKDEAAETIIDETGETTTDEKGETTTDETAETTTDEKEGTTDETSETAETTISTTDAVPEPQTDMSLEDAELAANITLSFRQVNSFEIDDGGNGKFYLYGLTTEELNKFSFILEIYLFINGDKAPEKTEVDCSNGENIEMPESGIAPVAFECSFTSTEQVTAIEIAESDSMVGFPKDESLLNPVLTDEMIKNGELPNMSDPEVANYVPPVVEIEDFNFDNIENEGTFEIIANLGEESSNLVEGQKIEIPLVYPSFINIILTIIKIDGLSITFECGVDGEVDNMPLIFEQRGIILDGKELFVLPGFKTEEITTSGIAVAPEETSSQNATSSDEVTTEESSSETTTDETTTEESSSEPTTNETTTEESTTEPTTNETTTEESTTETTTDETTTEESTTETTTDETTTEESTTEPTTDETTTEESTAEPTTDETTTEESTTEPTTDETNSEETSTETSTEESTTEAKTDSTSEESTDEQSSTDETTIEETTSEESSSNATTTDEYSSDETSEETSTDTTTTSEETSSDETSEETSTNTTTTSEETSSDETLEETSTDTTTTSEETSSDETLEETSTDTTTTSEETSSDTAKSSDVADTTSSTGAADTTSSTEQVSSDRPTFAIESDVITIDEAETLLNISLSFRQVKEFQYSSGVVSFTFIGLTSQSISSEHTITILVNLIPESGEMEEDSKEAECTIDSAVSPSEGQTLSAIYKCKVENLEEVYTSLRFNKSEYIAGVPTDNEIALNPVLTVQAIENKEVMDAEEVEVPPTFVMESEDHSECSSSGRIVIKGSLSEDKSIITKFTIPLTYPEGVSITCSFDTDTLDCKLDRELMEPLLIEQIIIKDGIKELFILQSIKIEGLNCGNGVLKEAEEKIDVDISFRQVSKIQKITKGFNFFFAAFVNNRLSARSEITMRMILLLQNAVEIEKNATCVLREAVRPSNGNPIQGDFDCSVSLTDEEENSVGENYELTVSSNNDGIGGCADLSDQEKSPKLTDEAIAESEEKGDDSLGKVLDFSIAENKEYRPPTFEVSSFNLSSCESTGKFKVKGTFSGDITEELTFNLPFSYPSSEIKCTVKNVTKDEEIEVKCKVQKGFRRVKSFVLEPRLIKKKCVEQLYIKGNKGIELNEDGEFKCENFNEIKKQKAILRQKNAVFSFLQLSRPVTKTHRFFFMALRRRVTTHVFAAFTIKVKVHVRVSSLRMLQEGETLDLGDVEVQCNVEQSSGDSASFGCSPSITIDTPPSEIEIDDDDDQIVGASDEIEVQTNPTIDLTELSNLETIENLPSVNITNITSLNCTYTGQYSIIGDLEDPSGQLASFNKSKSFVVPFANPDSQGVCKINSLADSSIELLCENTDEFSPTQVMISSQVINDANGKPLFKIVNDKTAANLFGCAISENSTLPTADEEAEDTGSDSDSDSESSSDSKPTSDSSSTEQYAGIYHRNTSSGGLSGGAIAGIIVACIAVLIAVGVLIGLVKKGVLGGRKTVTASVDNSTTLNRFNYAEGQN